MRYQIGEFAEMGGVSAKTLRFYDRMGLLRPAFTDARSGYRYYKAEQLHHLSAILALKELGASLDEIQQAMNRKAPLDACADLLETLRHGTQDAIEERRSALTKINAALNELKGQGRVTPVVVKQRPPMLVASVRARASRYEEIQNFESHLLEAVPRELTGSMRGSLWHSCADSGTLEGEPFVELACAVSGNGDYAVKTLPAVTVACAVSGTEDADAESAYDAIRRWMHARSLRLAGPKREIYLGNLLEIQFPLQVM